MDLIIYTVTLLDIRDNPLPYLVVGESAKALNKERRKIETVRCLGFLETLDDAITSVEINQGEMHEERYNYVVIEKHTPGLWKTAKVEMWYAWNNEERKWEQTACPRFLESVRSFAMG